MIKMYRPHLRPFTCLQAAAVASMLALQTLHAQEQTPKIGYLYPAGGQQGTTVRVTVGGQFLRQVTDAVVSGKGLRITVGPRMGSYTFLNNKERQYLMVDLIWGFQEKHLKQTVRLNTEIKKIQDAQLKRHPWRLLKQEVDTDAYSLPKHPLLVDLEKRSFRELTHIQNHFFFPRNMLQDNRQIAEHLFLDIEISRNAEPGVRELRLQTANGLTNPIRFQVGNIPEISEVEPNTIMADGFAKQFPAVARHFPMPKNKLPLLINGQIMPGDVDRFRFSARKGQTFMIRASARDLIPFLADAVPGWFQAVLSVYDDKGNEVAFADDTSISPDPFLHFKAPATGDYEVAIRDAIYRGRQDFVYRLTIMDANSRVPLPATAPDVPADLLTTEKNRLRPPREKEPNHTRATAINTQLPALRHGSIGKPGDVDLYKFTGRKGEHVVAEIYARRIGSPMDSLVRLMDTTGKTLVWNDDLVVKEKHLYVDHTGVTTHHADSYLNAELPANGTYYIQVSDTQRHGGPDYQYQIRISHPQPDYSLRITPSSISARIGDSIPLTVHAIRRDGFNGAIKIQTKDDPPGCYLTGGYIPVGATQAHMTLSTPRKKMTQSEISTIRFVGEGKLDNKVIRRTAVPADNVMQAFLWRHLMPTQELPLILQKKWCPIPETRRDSKTPIILTPGGRVTVHLDLPRTFKPKEDWSFLLKLSEPPPGISIDQKTTKIGQNEWTFDLVADAKDTPSALRANLIVQVVREFTPVRKDGTKLKRKQIPIGYLPAIPMQIQL